MVLYYTYIFAQIKQVSYTMLANMLASSRVENGECLLFAGGSK